MKRLIIAGACAVTLGVALGAPAASAAAPNCIGTTVSANAVALHPYGRFLAEVTPRNDFGTVGDAVAAVRSGQVDDLIYPNTCN